MFTRIQVDLGDRAVVFRRGLPVEVLGPGRYTRFGNVAITRYDTRALLFDAPIEVRALLSERDYEQVELTGRQRGVLYRDGAPVVFLRPGVHRFWTVDGSVQLRVFSVDQPVPELTDELIAVIPADELVVQTVLQYQRGLLYIQGRFERMLEPGRHAFWSHPEARVSISLLDMRGKILTISGQDLMTGDKVTLRLSLSVDYAPADPPVAVHSVADLEGALYLMVQLAARDYVGSVTLDELLEGREAMSRYLTESVVPRAAELGVKVAAIGVKDVVLPGDMKLLLNRVIEAEKQAAANVISRRDWAAMIRARANEAKIMADNPVLLEMQQLEAYKEIAGRVGEIRVAVGADKLPRWLSGSDGDR